MSHRTDLPDDELADDANFTQMVLECCEEYQMTPRPDGGIEVRIVVGPDFADLWIRKLEDLYADEADISASKEVGPAVGTGVPPVRE